MTGFFWDRTDGTVITVSATTNPTVRFASSDAVSHIFSEDYHSLCSGGRQLCSVRTFYHGEVVPVVYDPAKPARAFVRDWALFSYAALWLFLLGASLLSPMTLWVIVAGRQRMFRRLGQATMKDEQANDAGNL